MAFFKMQISFAVLVRIVFQTHTSDNVPLACYDEDSFQVFKITVKATWSVRGF